MKLVKIRTYVGLLAPFLPIKLLWICGITPVEKGKELWKKEWQTILQ